MIEICGGGIKVLIDIVVPVSFTTTVSFGLDAVATVVFVQATRLYGLADVTQDWSLQDGLHAGCVEIAQHVGISGTAGLDITAEVDVQPPPGSRTISWGHTVIYGNDC